MMGFNWDNFNPNSDDFDIKPIPVGRYRVVIDEAEMQSNKAKTGENLKLKMRIAAGDYADRTVTDYLCLVNPNETAEQIAHGKLSAICRQLGLNNIGGYEDLLGGEIEVVLKHEVFNGEKRARVDQYIRPKEKVRRTPQHESAMGSAARRTQTVMDQQREEHPVDPDDDEECPF